MCFSELSRLRLCIASHLLNYKEEGSTCIFIAYESILYVKNGNVYAILYLYPILNSVSNQSPAQLNFLATCRSMMCLTMCVYFCQLYGYTGLDIIVRCCYNPSPWMS